MNKLPFFIFSTFFLLSSFSYGQGQACDNMKELDELIKTENRNTDKYLAIKSARFYWWRRCQCESGKVVDQGGEKAIIEYLATGYDNSQWAKGKYSDIPIPNKRDFKTGDCFSTHEFKKTVDHTDCQSINYSTQEDPQRYITQYYIFRCMCEKGVNSESEAKQLVAFMDFNYKNANSYYTGKSLNLPNPLKKCSVVNFKSGGATKQINNKSSTQIEIENRFRNYNNAMNLKRQGENIAKAYANQVNKYSQLNKANTPEALLQNFNQNMQAISELESQNKADNLNQVTNTLNSSLNDLNSGNHEGALFSALSLIDQAEARSLAKWEAEQIKMNLAIEAADQMTAFYLKANELNNNAIDQYYQRAAYAFTKEEENYLLKFVEHHDCFKESMKANFSTSNDSWATNTCSIPAKVEAVSNNLIAKDIQYINAAKRKYELYKETGEPIFQQGAMRFAGLAATENPKTEYYYLMGHFAGSNNPLVAYSSFLTAKSKNPKYFVGEKSSEFSIVKMDLEISFKKAIEENNQEVIKNIVGAGLHQAVNIDGSVPIIYAIKIDQADVVQAFLNTDLEGKTESVITEKVRDVIMAAAMLDAPNTIERFSGMGFDVDFNENDKSPLDVAIESNSIKSTYYLLSLSDRKQEYLTRLRNQNPDIIKLDKIINHDSLYMYKSLQSVDSKTKAIKYLYFENDKSNFFRLLRDNENAISLAKSVISKEQFRRDFYTLALFRVEEKPDQNKEGLYLSIGPISEYVKFDLIGLNHLIIKGEHLQQIKSLMYEAGCNYSLFDLEKQSKFITGEEAYDSYTVGIGEINYLRKREELVRNNKYINSQKLTSIFERDILPTWESHKIISPHLYEELIQAAKKGFIVTFREHEQFIRSTTTLSDEDLKAWYKTYLIDSYNRDVFISDDIGLNLLSTFVNKVDSWEILSFEVKEHLKMATELLHKFSLSKDTSFILSFSGIVKMYLTTPEKMKFVNLAIERKIWFDRFEFYYLINEIRYIDNLHQYNIVKNNIDLVIKHELTDLSKDVVRWWKFSFIKGKPKEVRSAYKQDKEYWKAVVEGNYDKRY
jgi:hypothetical protein